MRICATITKTLALCASDVSENNTKLANFPIIIIIIIIIIDFYGAYILRNLSSEAQQNRISRRNRKQGRAKVSIRTRDNRTFMVGMQFGIDMS